MLPHGVTTAICDPHEIANVLGVDGLQYFLDASLATALDLRVQLSSCVPATHLETSGAELEIDDLLPLAGHPKALGLAEFMNFPGLLAGDPACLAKLAFFQGRPIDGHAPLLTGLDLNGYLAAGVRTDHEVTNLPEALEKLSKGMQILVREGSVSKDLHALAPIITERNSPFIAFCTDDRNPLDIAEEGHLDFMIRTAIALGAPPLAAYRAASISAARIFGFARSRPGRAGLARRPGRARRSRILRGVAGDLGRPPGRRRAVRRAAEGRAGRARQRESAAGDGGGFRRARAGAVDPGDRRRAGQDHHRARACRRCRSPTACGGSISTTISSRSRSSPATASTTTSPSPSSPALA